MPIFRARRVAAAAGFALAAAGAALAQQRPESILPPGFGEPQQPAPAPAASPAPRPPGPAAPGATAPPSPLPGAPPAAVPSAEPSPTDTPTPDAETLAQYALPSYARRPLSLVGAPAPVAGGVAPDAFGRADGRWLEALMRGWRGPLASRWLHIALRRALVSLLATPPRVNGADFAAERAWLLLRMGEPVAARTVIQGVDDANYTPKLYQVAVQVALATGDPAALCPLADDAPARDPERAWIMAKPICAALAGAPGTAAPLMAAARRAHVAGGIDYQLAQKVVAAGGQARRAVTIEWDAVGQLTAWRFGLATATGVAIPDQLYATVGPQVTGWRAVSPSIAPADRAMPAQRAAASGVLSNAALVDLFSSLDETDDLSADVSRTAGDLRAAYDGSAEDRQAALGRLWGAADAQPDYGRLVLTARAAAAVQPARGYQGADALVAAMLSAGLDRTAGRWRDAVPEGGDAWAMLLLADPDAAAALPYATLGRYTGKGNAAAKQRLLFAGLAGLGRLSPEDVERGARALEVRVGAQNGWTRALDRAARDDQPGTVLLLSAVAMGGTGWRGVPPEMLYRIVGALRATGLDGPARMIAAEAIARG